MARAQFRAEGILGELSDQLELVDFLPHHQGAKEMAKPKTKKMEVSEVSPGERDQLVQRLTLISRSLGLIALRFAPEKPTTDKERIFLLKAMGFETSDIVAILDIPVQTVYNRLSEERKGKGPKPGEDDQS